MARRIINRRELRAEAEAAEARGLVFTPTPKKPDPEKAEKPKPGAVRMRMVWAVCDPGGKTVVTFSYPEKAEAEAHAALLKSKGKGPHFLRAIKEPIETHRFDD
jgi:hypothetical protein